MKEMETTIFADLINSLNLAKKKWNVIPLIWRGSNFSFFAALYCSCLEFNALLASPSVVYFNQHLECAALAPKRWSKYTTPKVRGIEIRALNKSCLKLIFFFQLGSIEPLILASLIYLVSVGEIISCRSTIESKLLTLNKPSNF